MEIDALHIALETARLGGFAPVARRRGLDPSAVSRSVAGLEAELGFRLFQRTTRRLSLTEAGALYLSRVEGAIGELDLAREAARGVSDRPSGTLRLTASVAFGQVCVAPLLSAFRAAYPEIAVELLTTDARLDMVADRVDLAIRLGPLPDAALIAVKLMDVRYRVCAAPSWLATQGPIGAPVELAARRCLRLDMAGHRRRWRFADRDGASESVEIDGDVLVSSPLILRDLATAGLGPALLAGWLCRDALAAGRLVDLFPDHRAAALEGETAAWLLYPSRDFLPAKTRAAVDFLRETLGALE